MKAFEPLADFFWKLPPASFTSISSKKEDGTTDNSCVGQIMKFIILHLPYAQSFFLESLEHYLWIKIFTSLYTL